MDTLNEKMIMTGSNIVQRGKLKELDSKDARKRTVGIVLRMTWKVAVKLCAINVYSVYSDKSNGILGSEVCHKRMYSPGINGEGELRGQPANPGSPGKMAVKMKCV